MPSGARLIVAICLICAAVALSGCFAVPISTRYREYQDDEKTILAAGPLLRDGSTARVSTHAVGVAGIIVFPYPAAGASGSTHLDWKRSRRGYTHSHKAVARCKRFLRQFLIEDEQAAEEAGEPTVTAARPADVTVDEPAYVYDDHFHCIVSIEPLVVVVLGPGFEDSSEIVIQTYADRHPWKAMPPGFGGGVHLGFDRPVAWYSPEREIEPRVIASGAWESYELDTGRERYTISRVEAGFWTIRREGE